MNASYYALASAAMIGLAMPGTAQEVAQVSRSSGEISAITGGVVAGRATATFSDGTSADRLYRISLTGGGETYLRVRCDSAVSTVWVLSPRDSASGQATGRRMHKPFVIIMELDRVGIEPLDPDSDDDGVSSSDSVTKPKSKPSAASWDLATGKGSRMASGGKTMAMDDWHRVTMRPGSPALCS